MTKIRVGIFFGGPSREREISFAGGRTVYDNLDKSLFEAIPIFVDSHRNFILLDWEYVYKGTIRDFYPPVSFINSDYQIYVESLGKLEAEEYEKLKSSVGKSLEVQELAKTIDLAFLALHGEYGEDGQIQGLLSALSIPYTGSGLLSCALGMDKAEQKKFMQAGGFLTPGMVEITKQAWKEEDQEAFLDQIEQHIGYPLVIRPANQGSSIGVSIQKEASRNILKEHIDKAFFRKVILASEWNALSPAEKSSWLRNLIDIRDGIGFPLELQGEVLYHPETLLERLDKHTLVNEKVVLEGYLSEQKVIAESFIHGKEFSTIVVRLQDGQVLALPPTEIRKGDELYDYKSKYLPGLSRKITPIDLPTKAINAIRSESERLFSYLSFKTYARIDGFIQEDGKIFLNDPNTTSGMMPSSFFFHQAAEVGLNPSQFLTYIIRASLQERIRESLVVNHFGGLLRNLDQKLKDLKDGKHQKIKIGVILGGYSFERHISVESGRNIYEKLASSTKYQPIPIFLAGDSERFQLYQIPINLLLKDNADDIRDKIENFKIHPIIGSIKDKAQATMIRFQSDHLVNAPTPLSMAELKDLVDGVFIALHGRPGEDGTLQQELKRWGIPYNGSDYESSHITIHKYNTLQLLKAHGFTVARQLLLSKSFYLDDEEGFIHKVKNELGFPLIAKPVDDGCSSAVRKINDEEELKTYLKGMFRADAFISDLMRSSLGLAYNEEFPAKSEVLLESLIGPNGARHFLEITGGLLTHIEEDGSYRYEMFEPSEALSGGEILSLEEKFLAGEGQNITPARYSPERPEDYEVIATQVKADLERAARVLKVKGYARIDAFVRIFDNNRAETIIIEVNSLPGMTPATCIFHQTALNGYKPYDFIDHILEFAFHDKEAIQVS
jgi:UDP-N-acetylmuramate--alanine ligase